jgi:hypothetical protein
MDINAVPITFIHNGSEISGIANGTWYDWEFRSQTPALIALFPDGIINRKVEFNGVEDPRYQLIESTLTALDKLVALID